MTDEKGRDAKALAVPIGQECALYARIESVEPMPKAHWRQIAHCFEHDQDIDSGKWVRIDGWGGLKETRAAIYGLCKGLPCYPRAARRGVFRGLRSGRLDCVEGDIAYAFEESVTPCFTLPNGKEPRRTPRPVPAV